MLQDLQWLIRAVDRIGADRADSRDQQLRKALLVRASVMFIAAGAAWGIFYILFAEPLAGAIPLGYAIFSALSVAFFAVTRRYEWFRRSQLLLVLFLPFLLQIALGGYINASAVIIWSLICPLGALVYDEPRRAPRWFLGYLALVALSGLLQPYVRVVNNLSPALALFLFVMNIGAVSSIIFVVLYMFVGQQNRLYDLLHREQQKSESLLLNVLPEEIATRLKNDRHTIADQFDAVSVLFADLVGFTPLSTLLSPAEMVELLNDIFMQFDALAEKYGVEKIRTIGDAYMVAAGVPCPRPDHAQALARMALDMCAYIQWRPPFAGHAIDFRIGINSGPAVAGVIGRKKFQYDLWGDTVNTASRMESHGTGGRIQISRETYELLKAEFTCEPRGKVLVKGKGEMETWYLVGVKPVDPPRA
ncbi:MAG: guanylate cyclase [Chloroflexi bacterium]|nr:guanylate cyclase [Chloroflexota bacterium]